MSNPGAGPPRWPGHHRSPSPFRIPPPPPGWTSPVPPPHITQSPPLFLIRPLAGGRQSPMAGGRSAGSTSSPVHSMPPLPTRQYFQQTIMQNSKTEQISSTTSTTSTMRKHEEFHERKHEFKVQGGFEDVGLGLQPSYDVEFVYPPGMEPSSFQMRQTSVAFSEDTEDGGPTTAEIIAAQSQDYVDERLAEYQATIQHLQDEQERVQKKTFVNWINSYLAKHIPPLHVVDLIEDLKDGTRLLALLQVLSGEKLPVEKGKNLRRPHFLSNCNTALQFLQSKNIKLVNINSSDVVDGKPAVVLGLIWTIILYFQIEENTKLLAGLGYRLGTPVSHLAEAPSPLPFSVTRPESSPKFGAESPSTVASHKPGRVTPSERWKHGARKALLQWVQGLVNKRFGLHVEDFGPSWRDGKAFIAIINCIRPGLIDMNALRGLSNRARLETAFRMAEEELGIPRLLDPEDVDVLRPDEKSIMTYVAQFLHKSNEPRVQADSFSAAQALYDELMSWLLQKTQFMEHMKQTGALSTDYAEYAALADEMAVKSEVYNRLKTLVESVSLVGITQEAWATLSGLWLKLEAQLKEWQWRLDSALPEPFGHIGQWLGKAEFLLATNDVPPQMNDEAARTLNAKIEEHKAFFADLPSVQSEYTAALNLPFVNSLPAAQIKSMTLRLSALGPLAARRVVRLKFLEHKCCLAAFIVLVESRLKQWTVKCGRPEHVQALLDQYDNFVNRNKIFQEFQRAFVDMQHVIEEYKREGGIDQREGRMADHFLWEAGERWKSVSTELRCAQSLLEQVLAHWKKYDAIAPELNAWIDQSLPMLALPEQERMEYFQDVGVWLEKYTQLNEAINFLLATCDTPVTNELHHEQSVLTSRWTRLFQQVKQYQCTGEMLRLRRDFLQTLAGLTDWLRNAEQLLATPLPVNTDAARQHGAQLEQVQNEIDVMDETWRVLSRKFQSLVPELSHEDVLRLGETLKREKEALVRVRAQLPQKQSVLRHFLAQQESVDAGLGEIGDWVGRGHALVNSYVLRGGARGTQELLEKHRHFFMKTLYYRSMLDSKNKQVGQMLGGGAERAQLQGLADRLSALNTDFAHLEQSAHHWEHKLNEALRCWRNFEESRQIVSDWVTTADQLLNEKNLEAKQTVEAHKTYFEQINETPLRSLLQATQDLAHCLAPEEMQSLQKSVEALKTQWASVMARAPVHLVKLDFRLEEESLATLLKEMDREINAEHQLLTGQESSVVQQRHRDFFERGRVPVEARKCLERLSQMESRFSVQHPTDSSLAEQLVHAKAAYASVSERLQSLRQLLEEIPEQWAVYRAKFSEVVGWMDSVDVSLQGIMNEVGSAEQFETQKAKFLEICRDVDRRREDMKALVQMLDALVSRQADEEALREQDLLEELIQRYKNLVPTIEVTMIRTESFSKCYTYREDTQRLCRVLGNVETLQGQELYPDSLEEVEQMIRQQNDVLSQLEAQRPTINTLLQRGKDLQRDPNTPSFVQNQMNELDSLWTEIYNQSNDKLRQLKDTHKVWTNYRAHRAEILHLLEDAENELKKITPGQDKAKVAEELRAKEELSRDLRRATEDTLKKLNSLCQSLIQVSRPERRDILNEEVAEIERRLRAVLDLLDQKIGRLREHDERWNQLARKIEELRDWMRNTQRLLQQLLGMEISPLERVEKTKQLQDEISEKLGELEGLEKEARELGGEEQVQVISEQVGFLKQGLADLNQSVAIQRTKSSQALAAFTECKGDLDRVTPWIEQAQVRLAAEPSRPSSLQEIKMSAQKLKEFALECEGQKAILAGAEVRAQTLGPSGSTKDELDTAKTKWMSIDNAVSASKAKLENLGDRWEKWEGERKRLGDWLQASSATVAQPLNIAVLSLPELEKRAAELKDLSREISTHQSQIVPLTQECDAITQHLAPDGSRTLTVELNTLKTNFANLSDAARAEMNSLADAILARRELDGKMADLGRWMTDFAPTLHEKVYFDSVPQALATTQKHAQEHSYQRPHFTAIYEQVKSLTAVSPTKEVPALSKQYSELADRFQALEDELGNRKSTLAEWNLFWEWTTESRESIAHLAKQLDTPSFLEKTNDDFRKDIDALVAKCAGWEAKTPELEAAAAKHNVLVHDALTGQPVQCARVVNEIRDKLKGLSDKLGVRQGKAREVEAQVAKLQDLQQQLETEVKQSQEALLTKLPEKLTLSNLKDSLQKLTTLEPSLTKSEAKLAEIRRLAGDVMGQDPSKMPVVTQIVQSGIAQWDQVGPALPAKVTELKDAARQWENFLDKKNQLESKFEGAQKAILEEKEPTDATATAKAIESLQKASALLSECKPLLATTASVGSSLASALAQLQGPDYDKHELTNEVQSLQAKHAALSEVVGSKIPRYEAQLALWSGLEASKKDLIAWLTDRYNGLEECQSKTTPTSVARARLEQYRKELGDKVALKHAIEDKIAQLQKLSPELATLPAFSEMKEIIDEGFEQIEDLATEAAQELNTFEDKEQGLKALVKTHTDKVAALKDVVTQCESRAGPPSAILERIQALARVRVESDRVRAELGALERGCASLKTDYPAWDQSPLLNEVRALDRRLETQVVGQTGPAEAGLFGALEKSFWDKYHHVGRLVGALTEKIKWCEPKTICDTATLETKRGILADVERGVDECREHLPAMQDALKVLAEAKHPKVNDIASEYAKLINDLDFVQRNSGAIASQTAQLAKLWGDFDRDAEQVDGWLRAREGQVNQETAQPLNLQEIPTKLSLLERIQGEIDAYLPKLEELNELGQQISTLSPEAKPASSTLQFRNRQQALSKALLGQIGKLKSLEANRAAYNEALKGATDWVASIEKEVVAAEAGLGEGAKPSADSCRRLKDVVEAKTGHQMISRVVESCEALVPALTNEAKDRVREEARQLRARWERELDRANGVLKQAEARQLEWAGVEDNVAQLKGWLEEASKAARAGQQTHPTLAEKREGVYARKALQQELVSHADAVKVCRAKVGAMKEPELSQQMDRLASEYADLTKAVDTSIAELETHVAEHETHNRLLRDFAELMGRMGDELETAAITIEEQNADRLASTPQTLAGLEANGEKHLMSLEASLKTVLQHTRPDGHAALNSEFSQAQEAWRQLVQAAQTTTARLKDLTGKKAAFQEKLERLSEWVEQKESAAKEGSLKSTLEAKQNHLDRLEQLQKEVAAKEPEFNELSSLAQGVEGSLSKRPQLLLRFQCLLPAVEEQISRYKAHVRDHAQFNTKQAAFSEWINATKQKLSQLSDVVGDTTVLQDRRAKLAALIESRDERAMELESLVEEGEQLYAHTSPDGREIVRRQVRSLRDEWESLGELLQATSGRVDSCLAQFGDFSAAQEELTTWLRSVEQAMQVHTQLQATLPEKALQLQNHRLMTQEIALRQPLVEAVCDKAQQLVEFTKDASLQSYIPSIKQLFQHIKTKSRDLLDKLEACVQDHTRLSEQMHAFDRWLAEQTDKLRPLDDVGGEKAEVGRRAEQLGALMRESARGQERLQAIQELFHSVSTATAESGARAIEADINALSDKYARLAGDIAKADDRLTSSSKKWQDFDAGLQTLTQWFRDQEAFFRAQSPQASLADKEQALRNLAAQRQTIVDHEPTVNSFLDRSHELIRQSGTERVKPLVVQIGNRYQLLLVLSKEVLNRAEGLVQDHTAYQQKLAEAQTGLASFESSVAMIESESSVEKRAAQLQAALVEKEPVFNKINAAVAAGEKMFPDTSAEGREGLRMELNALRSRFETADQSLSSLQKKMAAESQQLASCQDGLDQTLEWLAAVEAGLVHEQPNWASLQDTRSKLLRLKSTLQDVLAHRRVVEGISEKAAQLGPNSSSLRENAAALSARYEKVLNAVLANITSIDEALDAMQQWNDGSRQFQEWTKLMWEQLNLCSDYSGGKEALQTRMGRTQELSGKCGEGANMLGALSTFLSQGAVVKAPRGKDLFEKELVNLRFDHEKLAGGIQEVEHKLETRLRQWTELDKEAERISGWLGEAETELKAFELCNSLREKEDQLHKFQEFLRRVESRGCKQVAEFESLAQSVQQALLRRLREQEGELPRLETQALDLVEGAGDKRIQSQLQQVKSRFQTLQTTIRDVVKKCEDGVRTAKAYEDKLDEATEWLRDCDEKLRILAHACDTAPRREELEKNVVRLQDVVTRVLSDQLVPATLDAGEKLLPSTGAKGREVIAAQLADIQRAYDSLADKAHASQRDIETKLSRWSGFEDCKTKVGAWLDNLERSLGSEPELMATLDEKRTELQRYRSTLQELLSGQEDVVELRDKAAMLPQDSAEAVRVSEQLSQKHATLLCRVQEWVAQSEAGVSHHQQYAKALEDTQEWLRVTQDTLQTWSDDSQPRSTLLANLQKLKDLKQSLPEEQSRVAEVKTLAQKVLPGTSERGQQSIKSALDCLQRDWEALVSAVGRSCDQLDSRLSQWHEFQADKDQCLAWLRSVDETLHQVNLRPTLEAKVEQFNQLQSLQGQVRARELEVDAISERASALQRQALPARSASATALELTCKYQQVAGKVKELTGCWKEYVATHQDFQAQSAECANWLKDVQDKLSYCAAFTNASQKDLEVKFETVNDLIMRKEEGYGRLQQLMALAQAVLVNTSPDGHQAINDVLDKLQADWSGAVSRMLDAKNQLDDSLHKWAGFLEQVARLSKTLEGVQSAMELAQTFQTNLAEKRAQLESIRGLEDRLQCEKDDVDAMRGKASEMLLHGRQVENARQAQEVLTKYDVLADSLRRLRLEREAEYKDYRAYKEAHEELIGWLTRARERIPSLKQPTVGQHPALGGGFKDFDVKTITTAVNALMNKKPQGSLLLERLQAAGEAAMRSTSEAGRQAVGAEMRAMAESFESLFAEVEQLKGQLDVMAEQFREWKLEFEKLSDWLQQEEVLIKAGKTTLMGSVEEKRKQVADMLDVVRRLEEGRQQLSRLNQSSAPLLASSILKTFVSNQLDHLNSRHQAAVSMAAEVLKKVENNLEQHTEYLTSYDKAKAWIDKARETLLECADAVSSSSSARKERLQSGLAKVQRLAESQEAGQGLMHSAVTWGEKTVRNTRSDGRDIINEQLKELQAEWDKLVKKLTSVKVSLETNLLQWADYDSSYSQVEQWITDRQAKLQNVGKQRARPAKGAPRVSAQSIGDRKATLRATNTIVQDIVSLEPMVESVTSKAGSLRQDAPASEISVKYHTLSKQAQEMYAKQKQMVEHQQAFVDLANAFMAWLKVAKERLGKCSEPVGDCEALAGKIVQLKVLQADVSVGQEKLRSALAAGNDACDVVDDEDREVIEEEVAVLQEEFDNYTEVLAKTQKLLEEGLVRWKEWEDQFRDAEDWLSKTELEVKSFHKLQTSLTDKKNALEGFQGKLQEIFDWQKELDKLNLNAQLLVESCADSRVSNAVTQLSTKFNALLSLSKEVVRRLESQYQEHQQFNTVATECHEWIAKTAHKLDGLRMDSFDLADVEAQLEGLQAMKVALQKGQNKVHYVLELKEKVLLNTEPAGAVKIQEDTAALQTEFDSLMTRVADIRQRLTSRSSSLQEVDKAHRALAEWLQEMKARVSTLSPENKHADLAEKRASLEKLRAMEMEVNGHADQFGKFGAKVAELPEKGRDKYRHVSEEYGRLRQDVARHAVAMEAVVSAHAKYAKQNTETREFLHKALETLQRHSAGEGDRAALQRALEQLVSARDSALKSGGEMVDATKTAAEEMLTSSAPECRDAVNDECRQLQADLDRLATVGKEAEADLQRRLQTWQKFEEEQDKVAQVLDGLQRRIAEEKKIEQPTLADLGRSKALLEEVASCKPLLDDLSERCDALLEQGGPETLRDAVTRRRTQLTEALTSAQTLVTKQQKSLSDHTEFLRAKERADAWITECAASLAACNGHGDETSVRRGLESAQKIASRMTEGQHLLNAAQDACSAAAAVMPEDEGAGLRNDMKVLRDKWDALNMDLKAKLTSLKDSLQRWDDFRAGTQLFGSRCAQTEAVLQAKAQPRAEVGDVRALHERLKGAEKDVESDKKELDRLTTEAMELATWAGSNEPTSVVATLADRWAKLLAAVRSAKTDVEMELDSHTDYQRGLQEAEKWLLQTSFQLMAHNSLSITNRQQTFDQLHAHEQLLTEIEAYQSDIDHLKEKGAYQIKRYVAENPAIQARVQKQLDNVQESYDALRSTAHQIKDRLTESLAKFQEYEDTLASIERNLSAWGPGVHSEVDLPFKSTDDSARKLEEARAMHHKLQTEKNRLALAVQACEAARASLSRPASPEVVMQPIPDREIAVRSKLEDLIDKVQNAVGQLTSATSELEGVQRAKEGLSHWADESLAELAQLQSKPSKLRSDAAQQEISHLRDIVNGAEQRQLTLHELQRQEAHLTAEPFLPGLPDKLQNVARLAAQVIESRLDTQTKVTEYKNLLSAAQEWLDGVSAEEELLEKGSSLDSGRRIEAGRSLLDKLTSVGNPKVEAVKAAGMAVVNCISNVDSDIVEEQVKGVERRLNDLRKRLERKQQLLEATRTALQEFSRDLDACRRRVEGEGTGASVPSLGFQVQPAEGMAAATRGRLKELEAEQEVLGTLERRLASMQPGMEAGEVQSVTAQLAALGSQLQQTLGDTRNKLSALTEAVAARKKFADALEGVKAWAAHLSKELQEGVTVPLPVSDVERRLADCRRTEDLVDDYANTTLAQVLRDATALERDCNPDQARQLEAQRKEVQGAVTALTKEAGSREELLRKEVQLRQEFERGHRDIDGALARIQGVLDEKQATILSHLQQQLDKCKQLLEETAQTKPRLASLDETGLAISGHLNEYDKQSLRDALKGLTQRFDKLSAKLLDKLRGLESGLRGFEELTRLLDEHRRIIAKVRNELAQLSRPIGSDADEVQGLLGAHEVLLSDLRQCRARLDLATLPPECRSHPDLLEVAREEDDLAASLEAHIARLRHVLLLQQQYLTLLNDVKGFLARHSGPEADKWSLGGGRSVADKIRACEDMMTRVQDAEAKLASAYDKGCRLGEEANVSMDARNRTMMELQDLRQQLNALRHSVEAKKSEHEFTATEHQRLMAELDTVLARLHALETQVKSRPSLPADLARVEEELRNHELLRIQTGEQLVQLDSIEASLKANEEAEELPPVLADKLSESRRLARLLPQELEERLRYLETNRDLRVQFQATCDAIKKWVALGDGLLKSKDVGVDFENLQAELVECKKCFGSEKEALLQVQQLRQLTDKLLPSTPTSEQDALTKNFQTLNELVQNTLNNAKSRRAHLEQMMQLWKTYLDLLNAVQTAIAKCQCAEEPTSTLAALRTNLQSVSSALATLKGQQCELDNLNERGQSIQRQGDLRSSQKVEAQLMATNKKWKDEVGRLETRRDAIAKLVTQWENCEVLWHKFEVGLASLEEHFGQIDAFVKSEQQLQDTKQAVQRVLDEAKALEPTQQDLLTYARCILEHLKTVSEPNHATLQAKLEHLSTQYARIVKLLEEKLEWLDSQRQQLAQIDASLDAFRRQVAELQTTLASISPFDLNTATVDNKLQELEAKSRDTSKAIADFETATKQRFDVLKQLLPPPVAKSISGLALELEKLQSGLKEVRQQAEQAQKTRALLQDSEREITKWVTHADRSLQGVSGEPQAMKDSLQVLMGELPRVMEHLDNLRTAQEAIAVSSPDSQEKQAAKQSLDNAVQSVDRVKGVIEERRAKVGECLDSWQRFLQLWKHVMQWVEERSRLLAEPLTVTTLPEARQKFNVYAMNVSSLRSVGKQLSEMGKEIDRISQVSICTSLHEKLTEAEQRKTEIEAVLLERNSLLQETVEEWEQYEKKLREVIGWLEKARQKVAGDGERRKPLRDQLGSREKMLADVQVQKTKISLSLEKLGVHFKAGIGGDSNIEREGMQLQQRLDAFHDDLRRECTSIEAAVAQIDKLQEEVQALRNQTISIEQQLRVLTNPTSASAARPATDTEIGSWQERLRGTQSKITARTERIKLLLESGAPIPTPLD